MLKEAFKNNKWVEGVWSTLRAQSQERAIRDEANKYAHIARMQGVPIELDAERVKQRLREKFLARGISGRDKSNLHIVYATPFGNWERHNIPPALKLFGDLTPYYLPEMGFDCASPSWIEERVRLDQELVKFVEETHRRKHIDIFVSYLSGRHISKETIEKINKMGIPTCAYWWDDRLSFKGEVLGGRHTGAIDLASVYDLNLTNSSDSIVKYLVEGGLAIFWPEGANPDHFRPMGLQYQYDVSFVGARYGQRPKFIEFLRRNGVRVEVFGPGWPNGPLSENEMVELYSSTRINLGFSGIGHSMKECCLKGRDFEVPMCGALYLTTEQPDLHRVYEVGKEVLTYRNREECLEAIRYLLFHPEVAEQVRKSARERCLRDHTWQRRFEEAFSLMGLLERKDAH